MTTVHYPHFQQEVDETFNVDNYVYIFSLFLHYACVKCPHIEVQKLCNNLKEQSQQSIAVFFTMLLNQKNIDKAKLLAAISEAGAIKIDLMSPVKSNSSAGDSSIENGIRTEYSPPTPRTKMLNEWNSENKQLRVNNFQANIVFTFNGSNIFFTYLLNLYRHKSKQNNTRGVF